MDKKEAEANIQRQKELELARFREEQHRQERKKDVLESVSEVVRPLENKIDTLTKKLDKVEEGTLSTLRNDILTCYYRCVEKGYRNDYDYQNIHHMYEAYAELHGNSYVADVMKRFDDLPVKEDVKEVSISKPKKKSTSKPAKK